MKEEEINIKYALFNRLVLFFSVLLLFSIFLISINKAEWKCTKWMCFQNSYYDETTGECQTYCVSEPICVKEGRNCIKLCQVYNGTCFLECIESHEPTKRTYNNWESYCDNFCMQTDPNYNDCLVYGEKLFCEGLRDIE